MEEPTLIGMPPAALAAAVGVVGLIAFGALAAAWAAGGLRWGGIVGRDVPAGQALGLHWAATVLAFVGVFGAQIISLLAVAKLEGLPLEEVGQLPARTQVAAATLAGVAAVAAAVLLAAVLPGRLLRTIGLAPTSRAAVVGVVGMFAALPTVWLTLMLTQAARELLGGDMTAGHPVLQDLPAGGLWLAVVVLAAGVVVPVIEEVLFRGFLQTAFAGVLDRAAPGAAWPRWLAVGVASLAFALVHPPYSIPAIFVLSIAFGYVYERTGSLLAPILCHAAFNLLMLAMTIALMRAGIDAG